MRFYLSNSESKYIKDRAGLKEFSEYKESGSEKYRLSELIYKNRFQDAQKFYYTSDKVWKSIINVISTQLKKMQKNV